MTAYTKSLTYKKFHRMLLYSYLHIRLILPTLGQNALLFYLLSKYNTAVRYKNYQCPASPYILIVHPHQNKGRFRYPFAGHILHQNNENPLKYGQNHYLCQPICLPLVTFRLRLLFVELELNPQPPSGK